ncbi:ribosome maturation factor RimM [[Acholeplasma] multilocale]|uniref:ribosome maturation factor RimM n=1 Tax=[Acholeplasma] multilocale TaxID=264638 RepID=UPI000551DB8C|nr:hypothetical protein [[Acholeplasma] multilocale]
MNLENDLLNIGSIVNTFGTKGVVKILLNEGVTIISELDGIKLLFTKSSSGALQPLRVESIEEKPGHLLVKFINMNDINDVIKLKGYSIYALISDDAFGQELSYLDFKVFYKDEEGKILDVMDNGVQDLIKVEFSQSKPFWVPVVDKFIEDEDIENAIIKLKDIEGLK